MKIEFFVMVSWDLLNKRRTILYDMHDTNSA